SYYNSIKRVLFISHSFKTNFNCHILAPPIINFQQFYFSYSITLFFTCKAFSLYSLKFIEGQYYLLFYCHFICSLANADNRIYFSRKKRTKFALRPLIILKTNLHKREFHSFSFFPFFCFLLLFHLFFHLSNLFK